MKSVRMPLAGGTYRDDGALVRDDSDDNAAASSTPAVPAAKSAATKSRPELPPVPPSVRPARKSVTAPASTGAGRRTKPQRAASRKH